MRSEDILALARNSLEDIKAQNIRIIDVRGITSIADYMIVASGTSGRHVRSIADRLSENASAAGQPPFGIEGQEGGEWALVDLQDVVVHVMLPSVRDFYKLEDLWSVGEPARAGSGN